MLGQGTSFVIRLCLKQCKVLLVIFSLNMKHANFLIVDFAQTLLDLILFLRALVTYWEFGCHIGCECFNNRARFVMRLLQHDAKAGTRLGQLLNWA